MKSLVFSLFLFLGNIPLQSAEHPQTLFGNVKNNVLWFIDPYLDPDWNTSLRTSSVCQKFHHLEATLRGTRAAISLPLVPYESKQEDLPTILDLIHDYHRQNKPFVFTLFYDGINFFILTDEENSYPCSECAELGRYALYPSDLSKPWLERLPAGLTPVPVFYTNVLIFYPPVIPLESYYTHYQTPFLPSQQAFYISPPLSPSSPQSLFSNLHGSSPSSNMRTDEVSEMHDVQSAEPIGPSSVAVEVRDTVQTPSYAAAAATPPAQNSTNQHHNQCRKTVRPPERPIESKHRKAVVKLPQRPSENHYSSSSVAVLTPVQNLVFPILKKPEPVPATREETIQKKKSDNPERALYDWISQVKPDDAASQRVVSAQPKFGPRHPRILQQPVENRVAARLVSRVLKDTKAILKEQTEQRLLNYAHQHFSNKKFNDALACYVQLDLETLLTKSFADCLVLVEIFLTLSPTERSFYATTEKLVRKKAKALFTSQARTIDDEQMQFLCRFLIEDPLDPQHSEYVQKGTICQDTECSYLSLYQEIEKIHEEQACGSFPTDQCPHIRAQGYIELHKDDALVSFNGIYLFIASHLTPCCQKNPLLPSAILVERVLRTAESAQVFSPEKINALRALQKSLREQDDGKIEADHYFETPFENFTEGNKYWNRSRLIKENGTTILLAKAYLRKAQEQLEAKLEAGNSPLPDERIMLLHIHLHSIREFYLTPADIAFANELIADDNLQVSNDVKGMACFVLALHYYKVQFVPRLQDNKAYAAVLARGISLRNSDCIALQVHNQQKAAGSAKAAPNAPDLDIAGKTATLLRVLGNKILPEEKACKIFLEEIVGPLQRSISPLKNQVIIDCKQATLSFFDKLLPKVPRTSLIRLIRILAEADPQPEEYPILLTALYNRSQQAGADLNRKQKEALSDCIKELSLRYVIRPDLAGKLPKKFKKAPQDFLTFMKDVELTKESKSRSFDQILANTNSLFGKS